MSFHGHMDNFGKAWDICQADGKPAHTASLGLGLERIAVALCRHRGFDTIRWPEGVKAALWR